MFGNVRDAASLPEQSFDARRGTWRVVVDYPFDEAGFTSADDVNRIDRLLSGEGRQTVVWLPRFFTESAMEDLALLVKLDWLFTGSGDRWTENSDHLSATDRAQALGILKNLESGTRTAFDNLLKQAYGIEPADPKQITAESQQFDVLTSLTRNFQPQLPPAANLENAFLNIIDQAFSATYPNHPRFEPADNEVTARNFETVRDYVEQASTHRDGRVPTNPGADRTAVRRIAGPLRVGKATEDHFLFDQTSFDYWATELDRAAQNAEPVTVKALQDHIESLTPAWGLRPEARDLVVSAWALLRKRAWFEAGSAITAPPLGKLRANIELRAEQLPEQQAWDDARANAAKLFGYTMARTYLTGANVADFATHVRTHATELAASLGSLVDELQQAYGRLDAVAGAGDRLSAAQALQQAVEFLGHTSGNVAVIDALAGIALQVALETAGQIGADAPRDTVTLRNFKWPLVEVLKAGAGSGGEAGDRANGIWKSLQEAVSIPGRSLSDELTAGESKLVNWVVEREPVTPPEPPAPPQPPRPAPEQERVLRSAADLSSLEREITAALQDSGKKVHVRWWLE